MYTEFFGLSAKPFELLPNPSFFYLSKGHSKALSYLQYGIQERAGFTLLTGEVGSGKTTLIRDIINKNSGAMTLAMIFNTRIDSQQLVAMINEDFGLKAEGKDKTQLLRELNDFLIVECSAGRQPIVIIDEAQNLSPESLEEVRLLSNLESDDFKLLQIVLVGQPELKELIAQPALRQLRQRISISCHLNPLSREETEEYIFHRLATVGRRDCVTFQDGSLDLIFDFSGGVPRLINVICDFLLLSAFVENTHQISLELVQEAVEELSFDVPETSEESGDEPKQFKQRSEGDRRLQIEQNYSKLNVSRSEKESIMERLSSQGAILSYLLNKQQKHFDHFEEKLEEISNQINSIQRVIQNDSKTNEKPKNLLLESRIKTGTE